MRVCPFASGNKKNISREDTQTTPSYSNFQGTCVKPFHVSTTNRSELILPGLPLEVQIDNSILVHSNLGNGRNVNNKRCDPNSKAPPDSGVLAKIDILNYVIHYLN